MFSSITLFYGHVSILLLAFIPSFIRAFQMLQNLETPFILEIIVQITRLTMFIIMISLLENRTFDAIKRKEFWDEVLSNASIKLKEHFPRVFIAQFVIFILLLAGLGNFIIEIVVQYSLSNIVELLNLKGYDEQAVHDAYVYFLKNMSVIPLAMVYVLKVFGIGEYRH